MFETRSRLRAARRLTGLAGGALALLALMGCTSPPAPEVARDSLNEVLQEPEKEVVSTLEEYDRELVPEPLVEPLECTRYLVITARGTGEPARNQLLTPVASAISDARPDQVSTLDLDYPADTEVKPGGTRGARLLIDTLNVQTEACAEQRFVLLGYSQGALVTGDALSDPSARLVGSKVGTITPEAAERIIAIVFFGDPRFVGDESYNTGSYDPAMNGLLPRRPGTLDAFADRMRDYCVERDFVCQSSLDLDDQPHISYFKNGMPQDGAAFVITQLDPLVEKPRADSTRKRGSDTKDDGSIDGDAKDTDADADDTGENDTDTKDTDARNNDVKTNDAQ